MNCDDARTRLADYWSHALDDASELEMEAHLAQCDTCRQEAETLGGLWTQLALIPAEPPSPGMRSRFYETLAAYKQGLASQPRRGSFTEWLMRWWPARPAMQFALSAALAVAGLVVGFTVRPGVKSPVTPERTEVSKLNEEISNMRQLVALSLLQQQSAAERLKGVTWSYRVESSDTEVLSALLYTVNHDSNVNVRLAAVDALRNFAQSSTARQGMLKAVSGQEEPLVQIALIDQLVEMKERGARPVLQRLASDEQVRSEVRQRAKWAVEKIQ